jgi:hypothetical protein
MERTFAKERKTCAIALRASFCRAALFLELELCVVALLLSMLAWDGFQTA